MSSILSSTQSSTQFKHCPEKCSKHSSWMHSLMACLFWPLEPFLESLFQEFLEEELLEEEPQDDDPEFPLEEEPHLSASEDPLEEEPYRSESLSSLEEEPHLPHLSEARVRPKVRLMVNTDNNFMFLFV